MINLQNQVIYELSQSKYIASIALLFCDELLINDFTWQKGSCLDYGIWYNIFSNKPRQS